MNNIHHKNHFFRTYIHSFFIIGCIIISMFQTISISAQGISEEDIKSEMEERGLTEEEIAAILTANGFDINNLENLSPEEVVRLHELIEELQQQKAESPDTNTLKDEDLIEREKEGIIKGDTIPKNEDNVTDPLMDQGENEWIPEVDIDPYKSQTGGIYGHSIFFNKSIGVFEKSQDIKAPDSYILGPGDEIIISIWGTSQFEGSFEINQEGYIEILRGNQRLLLKGLSLAQAKDKIKSRFAGYYQFGNGEFDVSLNFSRNIVVNIYGEVNTPGAYTLPAVNSAFNALVAANGPTSLGSVRNIQLIRTNGVKETIDVYEYMKNPLKARNFYLQENDIIMVPVRDKLVRINGHVRKPSTYELKKTERLQDLINFAGGFRENALKTELQIVRYENNEEIIYDVPVNADIDLQDGDRIQVFGIRKAYENYVNIAGAVTKEGRFERIDGMRITDLIQKAGLEDMARTDLAFMQRYFPNGTMDFIKLNIDSLLRDPNTPTNLILQNRDAITIWAKSRFLDTLTFRVSGAVRAPNRYRYDNSQRIRITEALELSGGLKRDAAPIGLIHRQDPLISGDKQYIEVNIYEALQNPESEANIVLLPFDRFEIISKNSYINRTTVGINGQVNNPGRFPLGEGMTLRDLIILARGFRLTASTNHVEVSRIIFTENSPTKITVANIEVDRDFENLSNPKFEFLLEPFDEVIVRMIPDFEYQKFINITGEVMYPGPYTITSGDERVYDLVKRAGGITAEAFPEGATIFRNEEEIGYIALKLDNVLKKEGSRYNFILKQGDVINIPKKKDIVIIQGFTRANDLYIDKIVGSNNKINVAYHDGKRAGFYVRKYGGGISENGQWKQIYVEHPNGEIKHTQNFGVFNIYPRVRKGSVVSVGPKKLRLGRGGDGQNEDIAQQPIQWQNILNESISQVMSILTLVFLAQQF